MKSFIASLLFTLLVVVSPAHTAVLVFSPNGTYVQKASLAAAATAADAVGKTVVVTSPQVVSTAIAWPADRDLQFKKGGYVTISGSGALTGLKEARPEWFGGSADWNDTTGTDNTAAIQNALKAISTSGGDLYLSTGAYAVTDSIVVPSSVKIHGVSAQWVYAGESYPYRGTWIVVKPSAFATMAGKPILDLSGTGYVTAGTNRNILIQDINFKPATTDSTSNTILAISDLAFASNASFVTIERCRFRYLGGVAIRLHGNVNTITHNRSDNMGATVVQLGASGEGGGSDTEVSFNDIGSMDSVSDNGSKYGINIYGGNNLILGNQVFNCDSGINLESANWNRIIGNRVEKHMNHGIRVNGGGRNTITNNQLWNNRRSGVALFSSARNDISNNRVFYVSQTGGEYWKYRDAGATDYTANYGVYLYSASNNNNVKNNFVDQVRQHGITLDGVITTGINKENSISGNYIHSAGQQTTGTYNGIFVNQYAEKNDISRNTVIDDPTTRTAYGIRVVGPGADFNSVIDNRLTGAGSINNYSASSVTNQVSLNNIGESAFNTNAVSATTTLNLSTNMSETVYVTQLNNAQSITSVTMPTSPFDKQILSIRFYQAPTTPGTITGWPANVRFAGGAFALTASATKKDIVTLQYSLRDTMWYEVSRTMNMNP